MLFQYIFLSTFVLGILGQIVFPELPRQTIDSDQTEDRVPLYAPNRCPENQLYYPGNQAHDWICDCGPTYIYYPPKDFCYPAYRQGPCNNGEHLIIPKREIIPRCVPNPCKEGFARYGGKCYEMGQPNGPCRPIQEGGGIFDVNATTLVVECLKGTDRLSLFDLPKICGPGSKRDKEGRCVSLPKYCKDMCEQLGVSGWVKNTKKGTVQGKLQGVKSSIDQMIHWLTNAGSPGSQIERCELSNWQNLARPDYKGFQIRF